MRLIATAVVAVLFFVDSNRATASYTFSVVAETGTAIPGGTGAFLNFNSPVIDGQDIAFLGGDGHLQQGIYTLTDGSLNVLADRNTPVPGALGNFARFGPNYGIDNRTVAFFGGDALNRGGIYTSNADGASLIANVNTPIPDGSGNFENFSNPDISQGNVVFPGVGYFQGGIYARIGGALVKVVDQSDKIPGKNATFEAGGQPSIDGTDIAFWAKGPADFSGIYKSTSAGITSVADTETLIPGSTNRFTQFASRPSVNNGKVAFVGHGPGTFSGVYTDLEGVLSTVADSNTRVPGSSQKFGAFGPTAIEGKIVAFVAGQSINSVGLFLASDGELVKIIGPGDSLNGKTIKLASAEGNFISGRNLAFRVVFDDDSQAVVLATVVPEPMTACMVLALLTVFLISHHRHERPDRSRN